MVPLPDLDERLPILQVHSKNKRMNADVDLEMVARGTPGMSGADLANLVNEAALHAVRRGAKEISMEDFENARDRVLMGQQRDSVVLGTDERERVAFHEGGHALLAYVLHEADPLHKITIIPRGLALGVTMQLPAEDRHIYSREKLEDDLCVRMGGRVAELLVYGDLSTGAADDLVRNTELARRMVREWGMSKEIGPMAWGSQGQVFLGEDLIHTRDYSDETSKVIDDEVERILREQEARAIDLLTQHRRGLDAVAHALLGRTRPSTARRSGGSSTRRSADPSTRTAASSARRSSPRPRIPKRTPPLTRCRRTAPPRPTASLLGRAGRHLRSPRPDDLGELLLSPRGAGWNPSSADQVGRGNVVPLHFGGVPCCSLNTSLAQARRSLGGSRGLAD